MLSKNDIKQLRSLHRKKDRLEAGLFLVEGAKLCQEAIASDWDVQRMLLRSDYIGPLLDDRRAIGVTKAEMDQVSALATASPALAVVRMKHQEVKTDSLIGKPLLALDGIRDPGNLGTIIRTADWFGLSDILVSSDTTDCFNPKVTQATMGSIFRVRIHYVDLHDRLSDLRGQRSDYRIVGAMLDGRDPETLKQDVTGTCLVIGNEGVGIRPEVESLLTERITIGRRGDAESLNAAMSAGILLYAWLG